MDAALAPRANQAAASQMRAEAAPVRAAVPTLLPHQSVAAAAEHQASRFDGNDGRPRRRAETLNDQLLREIDREVEFNEETKDLVSRTRDRRTGVVLQQYPAEGILKLRAYLRAEAAEQAAPEPRLIRDI